MGRGWRQLMQPYIPGDSKVPGVFLCPADSRSEELYDSTSYAYSMAFYHAPEQIDAMDSVVYAYSNPVASIPQTDSAVLYPSKKMLLGEWFANHSAFGSDEGWFGQGGRRLYLFADGHVEYLASDSLHLANDGQPNPGLTKNGISGRDVR